MARSRPFIFTNLAISMDGKIAARDGRGVPLGSKEDQRHMARLRAKCDAVVWGASTLRGYPHAVRAVKGKPLWHVIVTASLDLDPAMPYFGARGVKRLLIVPGGIPEERLDPFRGSCEIAPYRKPATFAVDAVRALASRGCARILLEGGGATIFPFAAANLVDEWNITLTPKIIGGRNAPTMVDGEGFDGRHIKRYRLTSSRRRGDEIYLKYAKI